MFKFGSKYAIYVIIAVVVIGVLVFIYFVGRRSGKVKIEQVDLPSDQPGGSVLTSQDNAKVRTIAQQLHDDMDGLNFSHQLKPYEDLLTLNDTLFVAVYNDFNNLFGAENKGTLRQWISDETSDWWWGTSFSSLVKSIIARMDRLNLR
jgi:hypothetical protein